ncbi:hypothetical protein FAB82_23605 [Glycomyces buryatensis]|uniref:Helicase C-terminal domain-containing protein n=1 Tax=Glycomyces buryatensis TaxID=2570927 RepID=A0A4S8PUX5_9ACTN|nr:hypothetical protein FAB82_23605 [Glycomyces buryatensis]
MFPVSVCRPNTRLFEPESPARRPPQTPIRPVAHPRPRNRPLDPRLPRKPARRRVSTSAPTRTRQATLPHRSRRPRHRLQRRHQPEVPRHQIRHQRALHQTPRPRQLQPTPSHRQPPHAQPTRHHHSHIRVSRRNSSKTRPRLRRRHQHHQANPPPSQPSSYGTGRWLVAVKMVSEGVDVPRLAVGVYATKTQTDMFFRQAVGRFVRRKPDEEHSAIIFAPAAGARLASFGMLVSQVREVDDLTSGHSWCVRIDLFARICYS